MHTHEDFIMLSHWDSHWQGHGMISYSVTLFWANRSCSILSKVVTSMTFVNLLVDWARILVHTLFLSVQCCPKNHIVFPIYFNCKLPWRWLHSRYYYWCAIMLVDLSPQGTNSFYSMPNPFQLMSIWRLVVANAILLHMHGNHHTQTPNANHYCYSLLLMWLRHAKSPWPVWTGTWENILLPPGVVIDQRRDPNHGDRSLWRSYGWWERWHVLLFGGGSWLTVQKGNVSRAE